MWNEIQIQYCDAYEIADALMNNEVDLVQLESVPIFAAKARLVEEAVWDFCKSNNTISAYLKYLNIYPHGIHAREVDDRAWALVRAIDTILAYRDYLAGFPNGIYAKEAEMRMMELYHPIMGEPMPNTMYRKRKVIDALADDRNAYSLDYLKAMEFTPDDLMGILRDSRGQVRNEVLNSWGKKPLHLDLGKTPESIPTGTTEVYFWGIPGTGHTCLIASIVNTAKRMGLFCPHSGDGLKYMADLASAFEDDQTTPTLLLPDSTAIESVQCLPLSLIEYKGKKQIEHRLSIIENSGEIFECFAAIVESKSLRTPAHEETFEQLLSFLQSKVNPKYHFFIVDARPGLDNRQQRYLEEAVLYFKQAGLFNETTQGISIIVTKCDELSPESSEWARLATEYVWNCYPAIINQLKQIVGPKRHGGLGISDGTIKVIPFSIGDVFLQKLCLFNPVPAERMVKMLMECSPVHKGWLELIKKVLP